MDNAVITKKESNSKENLSYIHWQNLVIGYGDHPLSKAFSGEFVEPGIYAILGPNGCGKTTLLKTFIGLNKPLDGKIELLGGQTSSTPRIAYVPQFSKVNHYFHITIKDFVSQGFGPNHKTKPSDNATLHNLLSEWQLPLADDKKFHELSGGQKTRAMVARAILAQPQILFMDEPLASLDACCQLQLMSFLYEWARTKQICVVMIEHHLQEYLRYIDGEIVFSKGHDEERSYVSFQMRSKR
jgi:ABC-type Mn2+/Zn2+ transport system ATPase subunit